EGVAFPPRRQEQIREIPVKRRIAGAILRLHGVATAGILRSRFKRLDRTPEHDFRVPRIPAMLSHNSERMQGFAELRRIGYDLLSNRKRLTVILFSAVPVPQLP